MSAETLQSSLRFWATRWPDRLAIKCDGREVSWGQFDRDSDDIAAGLQALGIGPGDAVGILMSNRYEFAETMAGALKAGAAIVLLNLRYTAREMVHPLTDSRAKLVVTEDAYLPTLLEAAEQTPGLKVYTADGPAGVPTLAALKAGGGALTEVSVDGQDAAFICYTSGTTGLPKGAVLSHRSIYSSSASRAFALGQNFDDRVMMVLPLAFTGGAVGFFRDGVIPGSTMYLVSPNDAGELLALIGEDRITAMGAVPVVYENMMGHEAFASTDLTSLRYALTGGATPSLHLLSTWRERGVALVQGYGLTESGGSFVTILFHDDAERKMGFAGRKLPNVELSLRTPDGREAAPFEAGEIHVRGPLVMTGYLNSPELTAETLVDGWLKTGDIGILDDEGYLKIVDRSKDMLISGGLNVYPAELERVLAGVPGLGEFAVIGLPDPRWGEVPVVVTAELGALDLEAFRVTCERELADYKRPRFVIPHGAPLPRTLSGKVQKNVLRERYVALPAQAMPVKKAAPALD